VHRERQRLHLSGLQQVVLRRRHRRCRLALRRGSQAAECLSVRTAVLHGRSNAHPEWEPFGAQAPCDAQVVSQGSQRRG
jgi:hypothetical protein